MSTEKDLFLKQAHLSDAAKIWEILQQAIERRRLDGSEQWQNGYPNMETVAADIEKGYGYVLQAENTIAAYAALILNDEPSYDSIKGEWLSKGDFLVVHRVAVHEDFQGKGLIKKMFRFFEEIALQKGVFSIKVDTNFDNLAMLRILEKLGYTYCGEVYVKGGVRKAFEKLLPPPPQNQR